MWVCMCVDVRGDGLEVYIFCCDGLHYGFSFLFCNPVCLFSSV